MSKMDSLTAPSKGIYFAVVLQSMCDRMNSPSAAAHRFLLTVPFLPGFDSFGTYLFSSTGAFILHRSGGLHNTGIVS